MSPASRRPPVAVPRVLLLLALLATGAAGCGRKGDLVLPAQADAEPAPPEAAAPPGEREHDRESAP